MRANFAEQRRCGAQASPPPPFSQPRPSRPALGETASSHAPLPRSVGPCRHGPPGARPHPTPAAAAAAVMAAMAAVAGYAAGAIGAGAPVPVAEVRPGPARLRERGCVCACAMNARAAASRPQTGPTLSATPESGPRRTIKRYGHGKRARNARSGRRSRPAAVGGARRGRRERLCLARARRTMKRYGHEKQKNKRV